MKIKWSNATETVTIPKSIKKFVIFEGIGISDFVKASVIKNHKEICSVIGSKVQLFEITETNTIICLADERELNSFAEITDLFEPFISAAEQLIAITVQSHVHHKSKTNNLKEGECFIRGINASIATVKKLKEPNFVTGISAGCFSWRMHNNMLENSQIYVAYLKNPIMDSISIAPIIEVLKALEIPHESKYLFKYKNDSNLYM